MANDSATPDVPFGTPQVAYRRVGKLVLAVKAPGSFEVSKWDRREWARRHTHALREWRRRSAGAVVSALLAFAALKLSGSGGAMDELIVGGAALLTLVLWPVAEYARNYVRAGEEIATAKARELELKAAALERQIEPHSLLEAEVLAVRQRLCVVLGDHEALERPLREIVSPWIGRLYCDLQEWGRSGLAQELHPEDNVPKAGDEEGGRRYAIERLADLDRILQRLRQADEL